MNKALCTLLFLALLGVSQCESFKRIPINQGNIAINRNLDAAAVKTVALEGKKEEQTTVAVKITDEFLTYNGVDATKPTNMHLSLHVSDTGFCYDCSQFVQLDCSKSGKEGTACETESVSTSAQTSRFSYSSNRKIKDKVSVSLAGESPAWSLKTKPLIYYSVSSSNGVNKALEAGALGVLGLGAEGDAKQNFGDSVVFSLKVNSTGKGDLIFGNDTSKIEASRKYISWKTSANWVAETAALYMEGTNRKTGKDASFKHVQKSKIQFDLSQNGTHFDDGPATSIWTRIRDFYDLNVTQATATTPQPTYFYYYDSNEKTGTGIPISKLPPVILELEDGNITLPVEALFKKDETRPGVYVFMARQSTGSYTVFGTHFLSHFYTAFNAPKEEGKTPFVSLHPSYKAFADSSSSGSGGKFLIGLIAVIGLGAVGFIVFRNKAASKLAEHLNEK